MHDQHFSEHNFVRKLLTILDCKILESGQIIQQAGHHVDAVCFNMTNKVKVLDHRQIFILSTLPEGSWFGDFNAFLNVNSGFTYVAHYEPSNGEEFTSDD